MWADLGDALSEQLLGEHRAGEQVLSQSVERSLLQLPASKPQAKVAILTVPFLSHSLGLLGSSWCV